jgi:aldehyde dehydrogenase (NAD+)
MATAAWKIAPALAFGNAVVFKPANLVPASAWALTEIISRQGLPNGTFNMVMGSGASVGETLVQSAEIDALTFTGSLQTGRRVAVATAGNLVRCQLEMGSKNALVVMDDADLDLAVECALNGAFFGTGQKCTASSRLIVCEGIHDRFVEALRLRMRQLKVGHALEAGVQIGPVADARQLEQNLAYLQLAQDEGATLVEGGERLQLESDGYYMRPALFIDSRNDMRINREEVFGPIACVIRVSDFDEALATLNDTEYGLTAGIITQSLRHASAFKRGLGARITATWQSGTSIRGSGAPAGDLKFGALATINLALFANVADQLGRSKAPSWLKGTRMTLGVTNIFDMRQSVRDGLGGTPLIYQNAYLNPVGRTVAFGLRKIL